MNPTSSFELRVLDGAQRGASTPVRSGVALSVSGAWSSDIVLRSSGTDDSAALLTLVPDGVELLAQKGQVLVRGEAVPAGQSVRVALYTPIVIGDTPVALGELGASAWGPLFDRGDRTERDAASRDAAGARRPWPRRLIAIGGSVAAISLSMLALAVVVAPRTPTTAEDAARAQALLRSAGFTAVSVKPGNGAEIIVAGYLETDAQRARAEQLLAAEGMPVRFAVWVNEHVATAVRDVYRLHGVTAEVEATGPGTVTVKTGEADAQTLQRVQATARRDVAGLSQLVASNQAPLPGPSAVPVVDDPGKRVSAIVGGDPPHLMTADGTRYFTGALLPTGHRIMSIEQREVRLEREGQRSTLAF